MVSKAIPRAILTFFGAALATLVATAAFPVLGQSLSRSLNAQVARTNTPIRVTATLQAGATSLRGFCYAEQIPTGLTVSDVAIQVGGAPVTGVQVEFGQAGDVFSGCVPTRFVLETPPAFSENQPINPASIVQVSYSISSPTGGVYKLAPGTWEAVDPATDEPVFGTSQGPAVRLLFTAGQGALPKGAFWTAFWQHSNGSVSRWIMLGTNKVSGSVLNPSTQGTGWAARCAVDLSHDGESDLLFEQTDGRLTAWALDDFKRLNSLSLSPSQIQPAWKVITSCDLLGNSQPALLFQHTNGTPSVWFLNGTSAQASYLNPTSVASAWRLGAAGKLQTNGPIQLVWQHKDGWLSTWSMSGTNRTAGGYLNPSKTDPHWKLVGAADIDGDGKSELLWRHDSGWVNYWIMNGTNRVGGGPFGPGYIDPAWRFVGAQ